MNPPTDWPAHRPATDAAGSLFAAPQSPPLPLSPSPSPEPPYSAQAHAGAQIRRLSLQCREILDRLRSGEASNRQLAAIALKYTGRISDLRRAGYEIECLDQADGLTVYRLVHEPGETGT